MGITEAVLIIGAVVGAASAGYSAYSSAEAASDAKDAANKRADQERAAALADSQSIREKADRLKGMQRAALATAGVNLEGGTADVVLGETDRLSEQDALAALKEGKQRADIIKSQGQLTADNYRSQSIASALGGASTILGGVTSYRQATAGTRQAATVNLNTDKALASRKTPTYSLLGD